MKKIRIKPEELRRHVHQALIDEFGDNNYICCYNCDDLSHITATLSYLEEYIIKSLIRPYWYAFRTSNDEEIFVKFEAFFLEETELKQKLHGSLQHTIDRIASEESGSEETYSKDDAESKEE